MLAEQRTLGSTGGIAPLYDSQMRISNVVTLSLLLAPLLACGEDAPTRPEDGTVKVWESCVWDSEVVVELCEPETACDSHGICAPLCGAIDDCPAFEGFQNECGPKDDKNICEIRCNDGRECPQTGGAPLHCLDFYCVGDL